MFFESCCFSSNSRSFNIYFKQAAMVNNGVDIKENMKEILKKMLRVEIQIKEQGIKNMSRKKENGRLLLNFLDINDEENYLKKEIRNILGVDKYVSYSKAIEIINNSIYSEREKSLLISIMKIINQVGLYELQKAIYHKEPYVSKEYGCIRYFKSKWLKMFKELQINPVTIPNEYGINELPSFYELILESNGENIDL